MAMFTAFFDASGDGVREPFVIVSGYIANFVQWHLFETTWKSVHDKYGVSPPFHAADLVAAMTNPAYKKQTNARQDYVLLATEPEKATQFIREISLAEASLVNCAVTSIVRMSTYEQVSSLLDLRKMVPPYALAARSCIELVRKWEGEFQIPEPVECIFEEGDFEQGKFTNLMVDEGMAQPIYKKKGDYAGLQGADHYAWERAFFMKRVAGTDLPARLPFQIQLGSIPKLHIESTITNLIGVCHMKNIDPKAEVRRVLR